MAQTGIIGALQVAASANGNGSVVQTDGFEQLELEIVNGTGTATLTVQGSFDPTFATQTFTCGVELLTDSTSGAATTRTIVNGAISVTAGKNFLYKIMEVYPYMRAVISSASSLQALSANLYGLPI